MTSDFEIDNLVSKFLSGEATPEEAMLLEDWKAESLANKSYFDRSATVFEISDFINQNETKLNAWGKIRTAIDKYENLKKINVQRWRFSIAASVVLLITIGFLVNYTLNKSTNTVVYNTKELPKQIRLTDASEIIIAPNSTVAINKNFGKSNRNITLKGSAFFSVKHDSVKPLIINMNRFYVKDLGTKFNIITSGNADTIYVSVLEGKVFVYDDYGSFANLIANERIKYIKSTKKLEAYKNRQEVLNNDTLNKPQLPNLIFEKATKPKNVDPDSTVFAKDSLKKNNFSNIYIVIKSQISIVTLNKIKSELEKWGVYFRFSDANFKNDVLTAIKINIEIPGVFKDSLFSDSRGNPLSESLIFYFESGKVGLTKEIPNKISEKGKKIVTDNLNGLLIIYDGDKISAVGRLKTSW